MIDHDPTEKFNLEVKKILDEMLAHDEIDISCHKYLFNSKPRTSRFYTLLKIQKGKNSPPGRPIVSANNSPTEKISAFVDFFMNPTVPLLISYVKEPHTSSKYLTTSKTYQTTSYWQLLMSAHYIPVFPIERVSE